VSHFDFCFITPDTVHAAIRYTLFLQTLKLHNSASLKYTLVLKIVRFNKMPPGILHFLLLESSDSRCSGFFSEGRNAKINMILKETARFSPVPFTLLPSSVPEEVTTNTVKLTINF